MLPALLLLTSSLAAAPQEGEVQIRFEAEPGTCLLKTITAKHELNLDEMGSTRSGSDLMRENVGGWLSGAMTKVYVDEYVDVADGRPQVVRRLIRNLTGHGIAPYTIHCNPAIPNVPDGATGVLKEGMMICIEPWKATTRT